MRYIIIGGECIHIIQFYFRWKIKFLRENTPTVMDLIQYTARKKVDIGKLTEFNHAGLLNNV